MIRIGVEMGIAIGIVFLFAGAGMVGVIVVAILLFRKFKIGEE